MKEMFTFKNLGISFFGALFIGGICKLGWIFSTLLFLILFLLIPGIIKNLEKEKQSYRRFSDACLYLEQMEGAYRKNKRIYQSLKETEGLFQEGDMKTALHSAVWEFEREDAGIDTSKNALGIIEASYGCEQMELMHDFFLRNEMLGGSCEKAIRVLSKRRDAWIEATEQCRSEKRNMLVSAILSTIALFVVSEVIMFFMPQQMNIMTHMWERVAVVTEVALLVLLMRRATKKNATDWLEKSVERTEEKIQRDYNFIETYDEKKEFLTSLKWSVIPAAITLLLFLITRSMLCFAIGIPITALMLNQHKLDYSLKKKRIKKEVERDYPKWLLGVILFMETESVQGAIYKSLQNAPNVLRYPFTKFERLLKERPTEPDAYFHFLEDYDVPKVHESMKLLYAISTGKGGNTEEQMLQIVEKNNAMTMRSEKIKNDNKVVGMMGYIFYPVFPTGIKMMADLLMILLSVYESMSGVI